MSNEALKQVFKELHKRIANEVNPDSAIDFLVSEKVITDDDYCELRQAQGSRNRCRDLMSILYRSTHPEAFIQFRLALVDDYSWIVDELDKLLASQTAQPPQSTLGDGHATEGLSSLQQQEDDTCTVETFHKLHLSSGHKNVSDSVLSSHDEQTTHGVSFQRLHSLQHSHTAETLPQTAACVVKKIFTAEHEVLGVTSVVDELFVLLRRDDNQVAVYDSNDYQLLRHLNVPQYKPYYTNDLTSCVRLKCLYVSDWRNKCLHRYDLASTMKWLLGSHIRSWSVPGEPLGLSVTLSCTLMVTCQEPDRLLELSAESGQCVRQIVLQPDIEYPCHGVQLTTGQYVVCHGGGFRDLHRVCMVNDAGNLTHSYGGQPGRGVGQLGEPNHLAIDKDSRFLFVSDDFNNRVVLLYPTLEFVRYVIVELSGSRRLHLHETTGRLFVGQYQGGGITVIQL